jgi:hypothetical protein
MDGTKMKEYIDDLVQQVNDLEVQFHELNAIIVQLQKQRDQYRALYEATLVPKDIWHDCSHCQGHEPETLS